MKVINFVKKSSVIEQTTLSHANLYSRMRKGLFPSQVKLGKTSLWIQSDVDAWCRAVAIGYSEDQIKHLVAELKAKRKIDVQ